MNETEAPPKRKRAKQQPLTTPSGDELRPLDIDGNPITSGVVTPEVKLLADEFSADTYAAGQATKIKKNSMERLIEAMNAARITECDATDEDGIPFVFTVDIKTTIKRKKKTEDE